MQARAAKSPPSRAGVQPLRTTHRRNRIPLSCDPCRVRKLKCSREMPCQNCAVRNEPAACKFRGAKYAPVSEAEPRHDVNEDATRQRIDHLEDLVKRLVADRPQAAPCSCSCSSGSSTLLHTPESSSLQARSATSTTSAPAPGANLEYEIDLDAGTAWEMDGIRSAHRVGDDWDAVLQEIIELKRTWGHEQDHHGGFDLRPEHSVPVDGSSLLFNHVKPVERIEIITSLPAKPDADRLIAQFFDRQTFPINVPPILHVPTFMREYNEHWRDPSQTSFVWLGLLYSILGIAMLAHHRRGEPPEYQGISESLFNLYRMRTAQCLLVGDISKCLPYTVETLRFNATAELNRSDDNRRGLWIMTGVIVRTAISMGYHRDPSQFSGTSALEAEYRRRIWVSVISMDDMASFLGGFPRMMAALDSNSMEPRNLHDWELSDDTVAPPPPRPLEEPTAVTYLIAKGRLCRALGRITDLNCASGAHSYEAVVDVDRAVHDAYQSFPSHMRVDRNDSGDGNSSTATTDFSNLSLLCMYYRGMCILHRPFLSKARDDARFSFSRDRCISSAMALLELQQGLAASFYRFSQTRQMLTLAAMILFLELELRQSSVAHDKAALDSELIIQILQKSIKLWEGANHGFDEAERVHELLAGMLSGLDARVTEGPQPASASPLEEHSGFTPRFDTLDQSFLNDEVLFDVNFDWGSYEIFP